MNDDRRERVGRGLSLFSHDGLRDSRTHLAAPPLLYEELRRELARASRSKTKLVIVRIVLNKSLVAEANEGTESGIEREILEFGQLLKTTSRGEDICARVGELEFLILFHGDQLQAELILRRIGEKWSLKLRDLEFYSSYVISILGESGLELLNRLDLIPISPING